MTRTAALVVPAAYCTPMSIPRYTVFNELAGNAAKLICLVWVNEYLAGPGVAEIEQADNRRLLPLDG